MKMIKLRKYLLFLGLTNVVTIPVLNILACTDDSLYKTFVKYVADSKKNKSAFFGVLGTRDDDNCITLTDAIKVFKETKLQQFNNENNHFFKINGIENNVNIYDFIKVASGEKPTDPTKSFWEDKNISWQKLIFNWIWENARVKPSRNYKDPINPWTQGLKIEPLPNTITADKNRNYPFESSTIFFLVVNGELVTAGQNWKWKENTANSSAVKSDSLKKFISSNILPKK